MSVAITSNRLGTAQWLDPVDLAITHPYAPGKFWVGRSPLDGAPIGYLDDRHVMLVSGSRAGKGTAVIIPNLCDWPGSILAIDPKGENATVTAARRGPGSEYCEGMGQPVHVLDPFGEAQVDDALRSQYNPLDELDPDDPVFLDEIGRIADAIVIVNPNATQPFFDQSARSLLKWVIAHVMTDARYEGRRHLVTVRDLITRGEWDVYKLGREKGMENLPAPHRVLWQAMAENPALGERIAGEGEKMLNLDDRNPKLLGDILVTLDRHTEFLDSKGMAECLRASSFRMEDLKTSPTGISVFMCLPSRYLGEHHRWLRMLVTLAAGAMEATPGRPASGHRVLFCLDEFAGLERMKSIERAVAEIAGAGVTLFFVLQSLEQLKATYKDTWETFVANCSLKLCFGVDDHFSREYLSKFIGETEVLRNLDTASETNGTSSTRTETVSDSATSGNSEGVTQTVTEGSSTTRTRSESRSTTVGENTGQSHSEGESRTDTVSANRSSGTSRNDSRSRNKGTSSSDSDGWSRNRDIVVDNTLGDTGMLFPFLRQNERVNYTTGKSAGKSVSRGRGWNEGRSRGRSRSKSRNENWSETSGHSESETVGFSESSSESRSESRSEAHSQSRSFSETHGTSRATADGTTASRTSGYSQNLQKRPLITPDEIGRVFDRPDGDGPAWGLVLMGGKSPAVVHRSPYFRDDHFRWLFDPHPDHAPGPKLIGEITVQLPGLPESLGLAPRDARWTAQPGDEVGVNDVVGFSMPPPLRTLFTPKFLDRHELRMRRELDALDGCELQPGEDTRVGFSITPELDGIFARARYRATGGADDATRRVDVIDVTVSGNRRTHFKRHGQDAEHLIERWSSRFEPYEEWLDDYMARQRAEEEYERAERERLAQLEADRRRSAEDERQRLLDEEAERQRRAARREELREIASKRAEDEFLRPRTQIDGTIAIVLGAAALVLAGVVAETKGGGPGFGAFLCLGGTAYAIADMRHKATEAAWGRLRESERNRLINACYRKLLAWEGLDDEENAG